MRLLIDSAWEGKTGVGRYAYEIRKRITMDNFDIVDSGKRKHHHGITPFYLSWNIIKEKPDVFWSPQFIPPLYSRIPFIFTVHDLLHIHFGTKSQIEFYNRVVRPACKKAYRVITVSESSKREIVNWAEIDEHRVVVTYNAVGPEFSPVIDQSVPLVPYLLYVGNHRPHKNILKLLEAFSMSIIRRDVYLFLTGEPSPDLDFAITRLNIRERVRFIGKPSENELADLYRGAIGVVNVSLYEGFGLPPLEAMACGTPCVVSCTTAFPEIVGDAALLVDPHEAEDISKGLTKLVLDGSLRSTMRELGIRRATLYSWDKSAATVSRTIREAVDGGHNYG